ncbi:MAG: hypothetical protein R3C44_13035 [Chloroflexota bacterium]
MLGIVAALAIPVAGNLEIGLEVLHENNIGSAAVWEWLDVRDVSGRRSRQKRRVIDE